MTVKGVSSFAVAMDPKRWVKTCAVVLAMAATLVAQTTARPNRIMQGASVGAMVTVKGTVHPLAKRATDLGPVNSQIKLESLTLSTNLSAAQQKDLDTLLAAQQDPKSPLYHQWLTQEQYGARFGLTDSDLKAVTSWLTSQGFTVTSVSRSRNAIHFSGQVWQVESAFHTQLHRMQLDGREHMANTTNIQLPSAIAGVFLNLRGLNNFRPKPRAVKSQKPAFSANTSTGVYNFLSPGDWAKIYDVTPIYNQTCGSVACDGTGVHVGVVGQTYIDPTDIAKFRSAAGLSRSFTYLNTVCIDPTTSRCTGTSSISTNGDQGEADMDIEWAGGVAKGATVDFIYAPYEDVCPGGNTNTCSSLTDPNTTLGYYDSFDALEHAVKDCKVVSGVTTCNTSATVGTNVSVIPVISMSYGDCEEDFVYNGTFQTAYYNWVANIGKQANSQGQTLLTSSGDSGPFTCEGTNYPAEYGVSVDIPADSPNYTGVGGTTLSGDESNPTAYWNQTSTAATTALQYIPESVWNDTLTNVANGSNSLSASGGGPSQYFTQPTWQSGLVSGQTAWRMVPDVSFAASPDHDGYLICSADDTSTTTGTDCASNTFWSSTDYIGQNVYGGTSASTPSFAGLLTLIVQKYGNQGNINPTLYGLATSANYSTIFHAPTGDNITPCTPATTLPTDTGCPSSGEFGYLAPTSFPYYSMAAGLGSIDGYNLFTALGGSTVGTTASVTTMSVSPTTVTAGATVTMTAQVSPSSGTGAPTGTVTFYAGSTSVGSATLSAVSSTLSTAVLSVAATTAKGFAVGSNNVYAIYNGNSTFTTSTSSTSVLTVNAVATATTTVTTSPTSIALGSSAATVAFTATVSGNSGTAAGTVQFMVGTTPVGGAVPMSGGVATLNHITPGSASGFTVGSDTVTATYTPASGSPYSPASGTGTLTVTAPAYTITPSTTSVSLTKSGSQQITVALTSTTFADSISWTATPSSSLISVTPASGTATLAAGATSNLALTIAASASAANHAPRLPWTGGMIAFGAVLAGIPLARRRKRVAAVLLTALAISTLGFMMSCGGGGGSSTNNPRSYSVVISGTGGLSSTISVTVQ